ncbi:MAG TPA: TIM-barrel domain-containing protein [Longimicrobiaceae bacterium]
MILPPASVKSLLRRAVGLVFVFAVLPGERATAQVLGDPPDVSADFAKLEQVYFIASEVTSFDPATGEGTLQWNRYTRSPSYSFAKLDLPFTRAGGNEFPGTEYATDPQLPFSITFVSPRTVRLRISSRDAPLPDSVTPMLVGPVPVDRGSWQVQESDSAVTWTGPYGRVRMIRAPWHVELYDAEGKLLTRTRNLGEPSTFAVPVPFSFVRRASDFGRSTAAAFELSHDEKIFGTGESFTRLDKRGQKLNLFIRDAMGAQTRWMYKPVPFFLSSDGYGVFTHTSAPVTFDFGHDFDETAVIYTGDEALDLFIFLGEPRDILTEYTALTGRSPVPPLWSFGLWMSRITYKSEEEVRAVAERLRREEIPADVIHIDTGWFEVDWQSDFEFSTTRFDDPKRMIEDLHEMGFHVSLWQLPYFTPRNRLYDEIVSHGYHVRNAAGTLPDLDAILDFSNPEAVEWYQEKLAGLLRLGVDVIKADFGEGAPVTGLYASGRTGWYEHNLYPVRYNDAVAEITEEISGERIIWGRSAWAGSQRYPLHWGGDAENTNSAMAATLRAGLSFGLSGFTYWSHDVGGFVERPSRDLYRRWLGFGVLTSHIRTHGAPPREPWEYDQGIVEDFRRALAMRYALMPYLYARSVAASQAGHPLLRPLFFEFPDDPGSWLIEDQYLLGSDLLVAPLIESGSLRRVYLPPGEWIDYQTGKAYSGGSWHEMEAGPVPVIVLARGGAVIPHIQPAQHTGALDWSRIELRRFGDIAAGGSTLFALPGGDLYTLRIGADGRLVEDPLRGEVTWQITNARAR